MTSNLASEEIAQYGLRLRRESEELAKAHYSGRIINEQETEQLDKVVVSRYFKDHVIRPILKRSFKRDEFLGRINEIVSFVFFPIHYFYLLLLGLLSSILSVRTTQTSDSRNGNMDRKSCKEASYLTNLGPKCDWSIGQWL